MRDTPYNLPELVQLCSALRDENLTAEQAARLEQILREHPSARRVLVDLVQVHAGLEQIMQQSSFSSATPEVKPVTALRIARQTSAAARQSPLQISAWRIAAVLAFVATAVFALTSPLWMGWKKAAPLATLTDAVDTQWDNTQENMSQGGLDIGDALPSGPLFLKSGYARIKLTNGVNLVLKGPAHFSVDSLKLVHLDEGKLTADVPHTGTASGFSVKIPSGMVTDLGTTFGITAYANTESTIQVIKGSVQAKLYSSDGGEKQQAVLTEDHAVALNPFTGTVTSIPVQPDAYVMDIHNIPPALTPREDVALTLHNTGQNLKGGDADAAWQITARSDDPTWTARPAVVTPSEYLDGYQPNDWSHSQWITTASDAPKLPNLLRLTFTTAVDLSGYDPATVKLHLRIWVDDDLGELQLNSKPARTRANPCHTTILQPRTTTPWTMDL